MDTGGVVRTADAGSIEGNETVQADNTGEGDSKASSCSTSK